MNTITNVQHRSINSPKSETINCKNIMEILKKDTSGIPHNIKSIETLLKENGYHGITIKEQLYNPNIISITISNQSFSIDTCTKLITKDDNAYALCGRLNGGVCW